uniref:Growth arrest and DNA damage inducible beta n=1 Tax=Lynx canadensis TaxID=61383 RepID=A0A667GXB4_LYNCA
MTLEELVACDNAAQKMQTVSAAVEELLVAAQRQDRLTVGVYESAKLMNVDPDSVVLCLLAIDEEEEDDIALQIHFTLIQSFCCDNDINIVRVSGMQRLAQLLGEPAETQGTTEARDLHCLLVTNPHTDAWKSHGLVEVASYCEESRGNNQTTPQNNPSCETAGAESMEKRGVRGHPQGGEPGAVPAVATVTGEEGDRASRRGEPEPRLCDGAAGAGELWPRPRWRARTARSGAD